MTMSITENQVLYTDEQLTIKAISGEGCYLLGIVTDWREQEIRFTLAEHQARMLRDALNRGLHWCQEGEPQGMSI